MTHRVLERFSSIARCRLQDFDAEILRYDGMTLLLWLMMADTRPDLTREQLRQWLDAMPVYTAVELVNEAVSSAVEYSFPTPEPEAAAGEEKPDNPTAGDI